MEMYPVRKIEGNDSDLILCFSFRLQHLLPHMPMYGAVAGNFPLSTFKLIRYLKDEHFCLCNWFVGTHQVPIYHLLTMCLTMHCNIH